MGVYVYCKLHIVHSTGSVEFHYGSFCFNHMYALMIFEIGEYQATVFLNQHFFAIIGIKFFTVFEKIDQLTTSKTQSWISIEFSKITISGLLFVKVWGDWFEKKIHLGIHNLGTPLFVWKQCRVIFEVLCFCLIGI